VVSENVREQETHSQRGESQLDASFFLWFHGDQFATCGTHPLRLLESDTMFTFILEFQIEFHFVVL
jgi:hypothetical protein